MYLFTFGFELCHTFFCLAQMHEFYNHIIHSPLGLWCFLAPSPGQFKDTCRGHSAETDFCQRTDGELFELAALCVWDALRNIFSAGRLEDAAAEAESLSPVAHNSLKCAGCSKAALHLVLQSPANFAAQVEWVGQWKTACQPAGSTSNFSWFSSCSWIDCECLWGALSAPVATDELAPCFEEALLKSLLDQEAWLQTCHQNWWPQLPQKDMSWNPTVTGSFRRKVFGYAWIQHPTEYLNWDLFRQRWDFGHTWAWSEASVTQSLLRIEF
jgi:hypothetical protein